MPIKIKKNGNVRDCCQQAFFCVAENEKVMGYVDV